MKKIFSRVLSSVLVLSTAFAGFASCGKNSEEEKKFSPLLKTAYDAYDRTGEEYDYDLTEYIVIPDYTSVEIPNIEYVASEEDIANARMKKLAYFSPEKSVDEPAEQYDLIDADYSCRIDGANYRMFDSTVDNSRRSFMAGIGNFGVPEIDDAIIGMKPGDTKTIEFTFPEPYYKDPLYSGEKGEFTITIDKVRRLDFLEYDDDFISSHYGAAGVDAYDDDIKTQLEHDTALGYEDYESDFVWEYIILNSKVHKYPGNELNDARNAVVESYQKAAEEAKMSFDDYVKSLGYESNSDFYDAEVENYARSLVEEEMILYIVARSENLSVSEEDLNNAILDYCSGYDIADVDQGKKVIANDYGSIDNFRQQVVFQKVYELLGEKAIKIDSEEYYKNKAEGKYKLDLNMESEVVLKGRDDGASFIKKEGFKLDAVSIILICLAAVVLIAVVVLVFVLVKEKKLKKRREFEKQYIASARKKKK